jgi:hypothetical protein
MGSLALVKARDALMSAHNRIKSLKGKGEEATGHLVSAAEVVGGSVAGGFLDERMGTDDGEGVKIHTVHGVPTNLVVGVGGLFAAFMGLAGKHSDHLYDISKGFGAAYGANLGRSIAKKTEKAA